MSIDIHFTAADWERRRQDWTAWWEGELPRPMVIIEDQLPVKVKVDEPKSTWQLTYAFPNDIPVNQMIDYYQRHLEATRYYGDALPRWWPDYGPGIMAGFLGARVHPSPETTWFEPSSYPDLRDLRLVYSAENPWWARIKEVTTCAVERWGDQVCVAFTDLGGNLDLLASLRTTQQLLYDLLDEPDEVARLVKEMTGLWVQYYQELYQIIGPVGNGTTPWAPIWSPQRTYMLQCDFSYMISPRMFEAYVFPDLEACCQAMEHGFYHMDGKGQIPHLDLLLSIERLRGIQWVPGEGSPPPQEWLPLLKRIRDGGKLCELNVSPEGARTITRALGGQGFAFHINQKMNAEQASAFLKTIALDNDLN